MTFTERDIEWIVVEVIRRLGLLGATATQVCEQPAAAPSQPAELALNEKLVTLRTLEGKLAGVERLVVSPRAVVTPAVRDELKQRRIELVRQARG